MNSVVWPHRHRFVSIRLNRLLFSAILLSLQWLQLMTERLHALRVIGPEFRLRAVVRRI